MPTDSFTFDGTVAALLPPHQLNFSNYKIPQVLYFRAGASLLDCGPPPPYRPQHRNLLSFPLAAWWHGRLSTRLAVVAMCASVGPPSSVPRVYGTPRAQSWLCLGVRVRVCAMRAWCACVVRSGNVLPAGCRVRGVGLGEPMPPVVQHLLRVRALAVLQLQRRVLFV
jgi:hypothetical protein